jgi:hypothetical protein
MQESRFRHRSCPTVPLTPFGLASYHRSGLPTAMGIGTVNNPSSQQVDTGPQAHPADERRRSQRVIIQIPVMLELTTVSGTKAKVSAKTAAVNDHGATVLCTKNFPAETKFDLVNERTGGKQSCRVTRTAVENKHGYLIPVEFVVPVPGFWGISFPPPGWKPD